VGEAKEIVT
jgi:hypothetical protein